MDIEQAAKSLLAPRSANMVLLGMAARHLEILSPDELRTAIRTVFARKGDKVVEDNLKAFDAGYEGLQ
jgi:indolepyruvate ferredoxin oxidoreductase beta subunit